MSIIFSEDASENTLLLAGPIGIESAAELKDLLVQGLASGKPLRVTLADATDLAVTSMQLLWAVARDAKAAGSEFSFYGAMPDDILTALAAAGLEKFQAATL